MKTKAKRLELQQAQFSALKAAGFACETHKGLNIFTKHDNNRFYLKVFRDTAAEPVCYFQYSNEAAMRKAVEGYKNSYDRREAYKAELKANPKKSSAANCAAAIREELKKAFPGIKFSIKSDNFSGGNSVRVNWTNGPTDDQVREFTGKYQYGNYNGMDDMYEYSNTREDIPQAKYVQTHREISDDVNKVVFEYLKGVFSDDTTDNEINSIKYRIIQKCPIPCGAVVTGLKALKDFGLTEDVYTLEFEKSASEEPDEPSYSKMEVTPGEVSIIDYSEKAIAVIGDTKSIKDQLKELGGRFNFRLTCGAGWIFPKSKLSDIQNLLTA